MYYNTYKEFQSRFNRFRGRREHAAPGLGGVQVSQLLIQELFKVNAGPREPQGSVHAKLGFLTHGNKQRSSSPSDFDHDSNEH